MVGAVVLTAASPLRPAALRQREASLRQGHDRAVKGSVLTAGVSMVFLSLTSPLLTVALCENIIQACLVLAIEQLTAPTSPSAAQVEAQAEDLNGPALCTTSISLTHLEMRASHI